MKAIIGIAARAVAGSLVAAWPGRVTPRLAAAAGTILIIVGLSVAGARDYQARVGNDIAVGLVTGGLVLVGLAIEGAGDRYMARRRAELAARRSRTAPPMDCSSGEREAAAAFARPQHYSTPLPSGSCSPGRDPS